MRYFSAFSGAGGFDLGMPRGWECVGMSEIDRYADMVLKFRFRDVENYGDIEKIKYDELPKSTASRTCHQISYPASAN